MCPINWTEREFGMRIYKKDDIVPMKFHYVLIFFMACRCFINLAGIPQLFDMEEMFRWTEFDWYGKFSLVSILILTVLGIFSTVYIFKRKKIGTDALYIYLAGECAVKLVAMTLQDGNGIGVILAGGIMTAMLYLAAILIIWVYYEKRREFFQ